MSASYTADNYHHYTLSRQAPANAMTISGVRPISLCDFIRLCSKLASTASVLSNRRSLGTMQTLVWGRPSYTQTQIHTTWKTNKCRKDLYLFVLQPI